MADEITISIDGQEIQTEPGKMVIQAAMDAAKKRSVEISKSFKD